MGRQDNRNNHKVNIRIKPSKNAPKPKTNREQSVETDKQTRLKHFRIEEQKHNVYKMLHKTKTSIRSGWRNWLSTNHEEEVYKALDAVVTPDKIPSETQGRAIGIRILLYHSLSISKELTKRQIPYTQRRVAMKEIPIELYHKWRKDRFFFAKVSM